MAEIEKRLYQGIINLEKRGILNDKFVIFGAGNCGELLYKALKYRGYSPIDVIDNSAIKEGTAFHEYKIKYAPRYLEEHKNVKYLVFSAYYPSIKEQMNKLGFTEGVDFYCVALLQNSAFGSEEEEFNSKIEGVKRGRKVYETLREEYGYKCKLYINPAKSIGDVYLMNFYLEDYKVQNDIVFVFGTKTLLRLAQYSGINNSTLLSTTELDDLLLFASVFGFDDLNMLLLHTGFVHFRIWSRMLTLTKITWMEHYRELFGLGDYKPDISMPAEYDHDVGAFIEKNGLKVGRTVILSPYANTVKQLSLFDWDKIANKLIDMGYVVYTNIGSEYEIPIHNTLPLHIDIEDFPAVVEKAGFFIGIRNGLCDFLIGNKAKKVVFFSKEVFDLIKVKDFYSLIKVGDANTLEIECDAIDEHILKSICNYFLSE